MRLPRVRFTVRRLMVVVAVISVLLGAERYRRRRVFCLSRASYHRLHVMFWCGNHIVAPIGYSRVPRGQRPSPPDYEKLQYVRRRDLHIDWHWSLAERFESAALHPWLALPAEPPCPGWEHFYDLHVIMGLIDHPSPTHKATQQQ
jgi:hypothetical protein